MSTTTTADITRRRQRTRAAAGHGVTISERMDLVVSIINYRTAAMTCECLSSILPQISGRKVHICVVDNASGDGSAEAISAWIEAQSAQEQITLMPSDQNSGFSGGHNQTLRAFDADAYFILNSDAYLRDGCIAALMDAVEKDPKAGIFAPRLEEEDGTAQTVLFRTPSPFSEVIRAAQTGPVTRALKRFDIPLGDAVSSNDVGWASFAAIVVRREVIEVVGLMDEGYFLYFEDTDYGVRATRAGITIAQVNAARVVHHGGGSGPVESLNAARKRLPAYFYASRTRLFYKAHGRFGLLAANLGWHLGRGIAAARGLVGQGYPRANAHEARDIWTNFLDPLGDRKAPKSP